MLEVCVAGFVLYGGYLAAISASSAEAAPLVVFWLTVALIAMGLGGSLAAHALFYLFDND